MAFDIPNYIALPVGVDIEYRRLFIADALSGRYFCLFFKYASEKNAKEAINCYQ